MKIKVVTVKDMVKYLVKIGAVFGIIAILTNFFYAKRDVNNYFKFDTRKYLAAIKSEIILLNQDKSNFSSIGSRNYATGTLESEFSMFKAIATTNTGGMYLRNGGEDGGSDQNDINSPKVAQDIGEKTDTVDNTNVEEAKADVTTEILPSSIPDKTSCEIFGVKLRNESDYNLEKEITDLNVDFNKQDILIFHTHTCESYTPTEQYSYDSTGNFRTTDLNYSVARVGDELEKYLTSYGYTVIHDKSYHDYPSYNGSYNRSLVTVENLLETYSNTDIVIDLHRDAIGDNTYAPKVKIGDEYCARLMFVIGTDGGGLKHDNWRENLKFAMKVVQKGNELYPGLFKPIIVRNSRYNHQVAKAACIIEVGATGNTLEECMNSMKYLAKVYEEVQE